MTIIEELDKVMSEIKTAEDDLKLLLRRYHITHSEYYGLPLISKEEECDKPEMIPVQKDSGTIAEYKVLNAWFNYYGEDNCSTKAAKREPGVMVISIPLSERAMVISYIDEFNLTKRHFIEVSHKIKNEDERFDTVHKLFPMLLVNNLRRSLKFHDGPNKVQFGWSTKPIIYKRDKQEVLDKLKKSKQRDHGALWFGKLKSEISKISCLSDHAKLREIREVKAQPTVKVDRQNYSCPMPILVMVDDKPVRIRSLKSYNKLGCLPRGKKPAPKRLVNSRLHLYEILPD